jgi:hypothetical protein
METDAELRLIAKLRKIEALFAGATTRGERVAAESARERLRERLEVLEGSERVIEYKFSLPDGWSRSLFVALLRRYGLKPYRYRRQRRTTVMVHVTRTFVDDVLWPQFVELDQTLRAHLESVTERIIREAIDGDGSDVEERAGELAAGAR